MAMTIILVKFHAICIILQYSQSRNVLKFRRNIKCPIICPFILHVITPIIKLNIFNCIHESTRLLLLRFNCRFNIKLKLLLKMKHCLDKNEPSHEKSNNLDFRPGPTQTGLYSHRKQLEA